VFLANNHWHSKTRLNSMDPIDSYASACCDLNLLISMSQAQVHTWPNFGEISSYIYEDTVFTQFFGPLTTVTLTIEFLTQKSHQHINVSKYMWTRLGEISFVGLWDTVFTRFSERTDSLMHSWTIRPNYTMPPVPFF